MEDKRNKKINLIVYVFLIMIIFSCSSYVFAEDITNDYSENFDFEEGTDILENNSFEWYNTKSDKSVSLSAVIENDPLADDGKAVKIFSDLSKAQSDPGKNFFKVNIGKEFNTNKGKLDIEIRMKLDYEHSTGVFNSLGNLCGKKSDGSEGNLLGLYGKRSSQFLNFSFTQKAIKTQDAFSGKYFTIKYEIDKSNGKYRGVVYKSDGTIAQPARIMSAEIPETIDSVTFGNEAKMTTAVYYIDYIKIKQEHLKVTKTEPGDGAENISKNKVTVNFNNKLDINTFIDSVSIFENDVLCENGYSFELSETGETMMIVLDVFKPNCNYRIEINDNLNMNYENYVKPEKGYLYTFGFKTSDYEENLLYEEDFSKYKESTDMFSVEGISTDPQNKGVVSGEICADEYAADGKSLKIVSQVYSGRNRVNMNLPCVFKTGDGKIECIVRLKITKTGSGLNGLFDIFGEDLKGNTVRLPGLYGNTDSEMLLLNYKQKSIPPDVVFSGNYCVLKFIVDKFSKTVSVAYKTENNEFSENFRAVYEKFPEYINMISFGNEKDNSSLEYYIDYVKILQEKYPSVISSNPYNGESNVNESPEVTIQFNCPVKGETLNKNNIKIFEGLSGLLDDQEYNIEYIEKGMMDSAVITFNKDLVSGSKYRIVLNNITMNTPSERVINKDYEISFSVVKYFDISSVTTEKINDNVKVKSDFSAFITEDTGKPYTICMSIISEDNGTVKIHDMSFENGNFRKGENHHTFSHEFEIPKNCNCYVKVMLWDKLENSKRYIHHKIKKIE